MRRYILPWLTTAAIALGVAVVLFWAASIQPELTELHGTIDRLRRWYDARPLYYATGFIGAATLLAMLPFPLVLLALFSGAVFDFWVGLALITLSSTLGAALSMLLARLALSRWETQRGRFVARLNDAIERDGAIALLSLRLTPGVPFFWVNVAAGLTSMNLRSYVVATLFGKLPMNAVFVGAGNHLAEIERVGDILTPNVIALLIVLAIFPWLARWAARKVRRVRAG